MMVYLTRPCVCDEETDEKFLEVKDTLEMLNFEVCFTSSKGLSEKNYFDLSLQNLMQCKALILLPYCDDDPLVKLLKRYAVAVNIPIHNYLEILEIYLSKESRMNFLLKRLFKEMHLSMQR